MTIPGAPPASEGRIGDRRILALVVAAALIAAPAVAFRLLCIGNACPEPEGPPAEVPFCSLPGETRRLITAGFRDGRSPDVLAVAGETPVMGGAGLSEPPWPSIGDAGRVPLVFSGAGVSRGAEVPDGTTLDAVAPTIAEILDLARPHPSVRSGTAIPGVAGGSAPSLVLLVVWKGIGAADLEEARNGWPVLRSLMVEGAGTLGAGTGSLPLDPAAVLATIGTGGLPWQHGVTGTLLRDDTGQVVEAWGPGAPVSVIAALGDDLDELRGHEPLVGVVGTHPADRSVIGGTWYLDADRDDVVVTGARSVAREAAALLGAGYGTQGDPDLLAVVMEGRVPELDASLGALVTTANATAGGSVAVVVTSTGSFGDGSGVSADAIHREIGRRLDAGEEAVEEMAVGGAFLDRDLVGRGLSTDLVVRAMNRVEDDRGHALLADAFPALAVSFGRYC